MQNLRQIWCNAITLDPRIACALLGPGKAYEGLVNVLRACNPLR